MNNKYVLSSTSYCCDEKIIDSYPVLKNYKIEIDYPHPNKAVARVIIEVDDLMKFLDDIDEEIILSKGEGVNSEMVFRTTIKREYKQ